MDRQHQRYYTLIRWKCKKIAPEIHAELTVDGGNQTVSLRTVERWIAKFKLGQETLKDEPRSGRPREASTPEKIFRIKKLVTEDRHITTRELADLADISKERVSHILNNELFMRKVCAKWVPYHLTDENKRKRVDLSRELLDLLKNGCHNVVTGDETWIYFFTTSNKENNKEWIRKGENRPQIARTARNSKKRMFCVFFSVDGVVASKVVPKGATVNGSFYVGEVLPKVFENFTKKRERRTMRNVMLHHDNATSHKTKAVTNYLEEKRIVLLPHPPYSPDLAPCDFFLFPEIKKKLAGRHFDRIENLARAVKAITDNIETHEYEKCFKDWQIRLKRCIEVHGEYFEGMH